jgi:hypothetical protein
LLCEGCSLIGQGAVGGAASSVLKQLRAAVLPAMDVDAGCSFGCPLLWLDQVFVQELPGGACVAGGLACCMDARRGCRVASSVACSVVLQRAGCSGAVPGVGGDGGDGGWQVGHLHWHTLVSPQPGFV